MAAIHELELLDDGRLLRARNPGLLARWMHDHRIVSLTMRAWGPGGLGA